MSDLFPDATPAQLRNRITMQSEFIRLLQAATKINLARANQSPDGDYVLNPNGENLNDERKVRRTLEERFGLRYGHA